jgi:tRNA(Ile)-lysidine synthase
VNLLRKVTEFIKNHRLLSAGDRVLVAVSGGPDSVALLHILSDLRSELELHLEVAHLQHGIRGEDAQQDARFVAELADKLGFRFHVKEINLPEIRSTMGKVNLEALAREERYRFLADVARERNIRKVATAHTQDDQAETVLMWFLRGCGMKGLGGMAPLRPLRSAKDDLLVLRPLLGVSKAEIFEFLKQKQLGYRLDRTNQDPNLLRNWIRLRLFPQVKERIDAQLPSRLAQQAELLRDEDCFLANLAGQELNKIRVLKGMNLRLFLNQDKALQRRLLRLWIQETRGHVRGLDADHVEAMMRLATDGPSQSRLSLPGRWELVKEYETLRLEKRSNRVMKSLCYSYELTIGGELKIAEAGITIRSEYVAPPLSRLPQDLMEAVFDATELAPGLTVRNYRRGDRFRPLGMVGEKKIKDLFIEKKIPLWVRARLPLLSMGDEILWIPGYGRSEIGRVSPQTSSILRLTVGSNSSSNATLVC